MLQKLKQPTLLAFLLIVLIAGTNFVAVKYSNEELPPFWGAFLRFFSSALILYLYAYVKKIPLPTGKVFTGSIIYGVLNFGITYALAYWALIKVPSGIASVTFSLVPLFTFFLAILQGLEKFKFQVLLGSFIAVTGILIIFNNQISANIPLPGLLALIAAAIVAAQSGIVVKKLPDVHPVSINVVGMFAGSIILLFISLLSNEVKVLPSNLSTSLALFYLVFLGTIALFLLFIYVIRKWTATATSYQLVLAPLVTMVVANVLRGETIEPVTVFGSIIVISGVYLGAIASAKN